MIEDEIVGWYSTISGHEFEQALGDGDGREVLLSMGLQGQTKTQQLNSSNIIT